MARVLCAMSGGVDSSVAALLLKEAGHEVIGVFLHLELPEPLAAPGSPSGRRSCCGTEDTLDADHVAGRLGIPFYSLEPRDEFSRIIDGFVEEYHRGRTPNPCARCNREIKFGFLSEKARAFGCEAIATGHYARILPGPGGSLRLARARDLSKDQSYFLFLVPRSVLERTIFPVGDLSKREVREIAGRAGLPVAGKRESQEICFVPGDYRDVLRALGPDRIRSGRFIDTRGNDLGEHPGHQHFTIGQRRGLGRGFGEPRYVVRIDAERNAVVLGGKEDLRTSTMEVDEVVWSSIPDPAPGDTLRALVQVRYRHAAAAARIAVKGGRRVRVEFDEPESSITPGQAAVFYDGEVLLGGGWILGPAP